VTDAEFTGQHYSQSAFEFETSRLTEHCPVEFAITRRLLDRWIPEGAAITEIGVGVGHYSEHLAARGCRIHLVDVSQRLLDAAVARLQAAGLTAQVTGVSLLSATDPSGLASGSCDAVLLLGPLYHLCELADRRRAVSEAARVLKQGGLLYAAGINRLPYFRDLFRESPHQATKRRGFHEQFLRDGNVDPEHAPPLGFGHLTTVAEFRKLFAELLEPVALLGIESFTAAWQPVLNELPAEEIEAWLDLVEQTGVTPEGLGASDHFLYVGRTKRV
jgi:S-adenosylmethionine-dependent methyltransferase